MPSKAVKAMRAARALASTPPPVDQDWLFRPAHKHSDSYTDGGICSSCGKANPGKNVGGGASRSVGGVPLTKKNGAPIMLLKNNMPKVRNQFVAGGLYQASNASMQ